MAAPAPGPRPLVREDLERARDTAFRRVPARRIRGERDALAFVDEVGVCSTFYRFPEVLSDHPHLEQASRIRIRDTAQAVRLALWDEKAGRLVPFEAG